MAMSHCGVTTLHEEETDPVSTLELYAPTFMGTRHHYKNSFANDNYDNFHVVTVSLKLMWFQHKSVVFQV